MLWCSLKQRNTFAHRAAYSGDCISLVTHPFYPDKRGDKIFMAMPHNSKCRYGERGAADAKPKAQIILDAAKVSAASGGCSEPKQGQRSQSARGFCPRSTMRVPQPDIIEHFGNADAVPQPPKRCLSRKAGIVRCCPTQMVTLPQTQNSAAFVETGDGFGFSGAPLREESIF